MGQEYDNFFYLLLQLIMPGCYIYTTFFEVLKKLNAGIAQLVERNLAKVDVAGSSPVSRSNIPIQFGIFFLCSKLY